MSMKTRKEEETESRKQWTSPRMCQSKVTLIQQDVSCQSDSFPADPFQMRMHGSGSLGRICILCHRWRHRETGMFKKMENIHSLVNKKENKANVMKFASNQETTTKKYSWMECKKRLEFPIDGRYISFQVTQACHWMCIEENGLASTWLSVNSMYIAKIIQMLFICTQCSDQPIGKPQKA